MLDDTVTKYEILALRAELGLRQVDVALECHVDRRTIINMEHGVAVTRQTALQVFFGVNRLRAARGLSPLAFEDISWNLL